jgi:RNA polymerase II subunit A-like phosphatase
LKPCPFSSNKHIDDFFVGIGDINSAFLPKLNGLAVAPAPKTPAAPTNTSGPAPSAADASSSPTSTASGEAAKAAEEAAADAVLTQAAEVLDAQLEDRPLAKKQEELTEHDAVVAVADPNKPAAERASESPAQTEEPAKTRQPKKALLTNDDHELDRIRAVRITVPFP